MQERRQVSIFVMHIRRDEWLLDGTMKGIMKGKDGHQVKVKMWGENMGKH